MNRCDRQRFLITTITASLVMGAAAASAADGNDPDWPCEQALVPEISAAVVWDGPSVDGLSDQWQSDMQVAALTKRLTGRDTDPNEFEPSIEAFAKAQPVSNRDARLTLLFVGVLSILNADRRMLNDGILRYSRDQERRARILDGHLSEMVELESDQSPGGAKRLVELQDVVQIEQRIFDDREKTIPFLCTRPRVIEERIGELARTISAQLE
ncbi:MAG: hypothetical protein WBG92_16440 [Thiohalocapsa sp.]